MATTYEPLVAGKIWVKTYMVRFAASRFTARTAVVKLADGKLWVHSPGDLSDALKGQLKALGEVGYLVAPSNWHHVHMPEWQLAYPSAKVYICPGLDTKRPDLAQRATVLAETPPSEWGNEFQQVVLRGKLHSEVLFLHTPTKSLLVSDMVVYVTDKSLETDGTQDDPGTWLLTRLFSTRNRPVANLMARTFGFEGQAQAKANLNRIVYEWKADRIVVNHGQIIEGALATENVLKDCWKSML